ncbi:MAG: hypothetical protein H6841_05520 [Planctomycetes bacterium]|nr:hypothetical protein [Planctomycetota bacterium]MCB9934387.1 hypothetical protein [Planctomycetota bacterium]
MDDGELRVLWKIRIAGMKATAARTQQERREANFEELLQRTAQCFIPPHHDSGTVHGEEKEEARVRSVWARIRRGSLERMDA